MKGRVYMENDSSPNQNNFSFEVYIQKAPFIEINLSIATPMKNWNFIFSSWKSCPFFSCMVGMVWVLYLLSSKFIQNSQI